MRQLLTGNEAVARGVYEAGVLFAAAYPGTPSTEILENISTYKGDIKAEWAPNEKVALESAIGFAIAGGRAFASMKQVGLNVAADPLFSFAYTGTNAGLVLVTADEPGIHSSQTEQDNRYYAKFAKVPMLEPSDSEQCRDMVIEGYRLSEKYRVPVLMRMTTRVCHSKSVVQLGERQQPQKSEYKKDIWQYTTMPAVAQKLRVEIVEKMARLKEESEASPLNFEVWNTDDIGIVTSGISYQYAKDAFGKDASYLKLGFTYPLPIDKIKDFAARVKKLVVIEETEPYMEEQIRAAGIACTGKDVLPEVGELSAPLLKKLLRGIDEQCTPADAIVPPPRPPVLCAGCPHRGAFYEIARRKNLMVTGDIGCYGLGAMAPLDAVDTVLCMGASVSMGHGAAQAHKMLGEDKRAVCVIGDSTFFHSGMTSLLDIIYNDSNAITVILDNRTTGMTGHQDHPGTGYSAQGDKANETDIPAVVKALGIKHVRTVNPLKLSDMEGALNWALAKDEPSVIITRWPCVLKRMSGEDKAEFDLTKRVLAVDEEKCIGCKKCIKTGCPALRFDKATKKASIDALSCIGCEVCAQVCPVDAIAQAGEAKTS